MSRLPTLACPHVSESVIAAVLAAMVSVGLLGGVLDLFVEDGAPFERVASTGAPCIAPAHVSEAVACMGVIAQ